MENTQKDGNVISKFKMWILGQSPAGLGTLLLGIAGFIALCQTSGILDKIMQIQGQAVEIKQGVTEIKKAVDILTQQLLTNHARQTVQNSPLKNAEATKEQIQMTVDSIPSAASCGVSIYLPRESRDQVVDKLQKSKSPDERQFVLQNSLQYKTSSENCNFN